MRQSRDEGEEGGVPRHTGTARGVQQHVSGHHHPLVLVLGLTVDHHAVDGVSLDPDSVAVPVVGHGLELDLKGTVGALQGHLATIRPGLPRSKQQQQQQQSSLPRLRILPTIYQFMLFGIAMILAQLCPILCPKYANIKVIIILQHYT